MPTGERSLWLQKHNTQTGNLLAGTWPVDTGKPVLSTPQLPTGNSREGGGVPYLKESRNKETKKKGATVNDKTARTSTANGT